MNTNFSKKLIFKLLCIPIWLFLGFLGLETYSKYKEYTVRIDWGEGKRQIDESKVMEAFDKTLWEAPYFKYKKNSSVSHKNSKGHFQAEISSLGLRNKEIELPKPKNRYRIVCVGGSTTVEGQTNSQTYPSLLESWLKKRINENKYQLEVINFGVSGLNSIGELKKVNEVISLEPDLVIHSNAVNDICWLLFKKWQLVGSMYDLFFQSSFLRSQIGLMSILNEKAIKRDVQNLSMNNLIKFRDRLKKAKVDSVFLAYHALSPAKMTHHEIDLFNYDVSQNWKGYYINYHNYYKVVQIYNQSLSENMVDGSAYLKPDYDIPFKYYNDICHLDQPGIQLKAEAIGEVLLPYLLEKFKDLP